MNKLSILLLHFAFLISILISFSFGNKEIFQTGFYILAIIFEYLIFIIAIDNSKLEPKSGVEE